MLDRHQMSHELNQIYQLHACTYCNNLELYTRPVTQYIAIILQGFSNINNCNNLLEFNINYCNILQYIAICVLLKSVRVIITEVITCRTNRSQN